MELTDVGEQMGLSVECSMVVFFSCLLFSKLRPGRDRELEASLASAATQKERGDALCFFLSLYLVSETHYYFMNSFMHGEIGIT